MKMMEREINKSANGKSYTTHLMHLVLLLLMVMMPTAVDALENGLARTPPMGWLAWERYVCETDCQKYPSECINFELFDQMAERMQSEGYRLAGYEYVNIDDCWSERKRSSDGKLVPAVDRFGGANGLRKLADHVHARGLKLGIYGDCGTATCQNFPGQLSDPNSLEGNFFQVDAESFAEWQVDSFKFDACYVNASRAAGLCSPMERALNASGRPTLFSCSWPAYENDAHLTTDWQLLVDKCNLWRAFGDIEDSWRSVLETIDWFVREQDTVVRFHGPGGWFDADQLVVGNFGLSPDQERAQFAIWCVWASPLYMSNDLRAISEESSKLLRNRWAIAVNQDPLGIFGLMVHEAARGSFQVFVKPVTPLSPVDGCPDYALVYLDRRTLGSARFLSATLSHLLAAVHEKLARVPKWAARWSHCANQSAPVEFAARDVFKDFAVVRDHLRLADDLELKVDPSGVRMVVLQRQTPTKPMQS